MFASHWCEIPVSVITKGKHIVFLEESSRLLFYHLVEQTLPTQGLFECKTHTACYSDTYLAWVVCGSVATPMWISGYDTHLMGLHFALRLVVKKKLQFILIILFCMDCLISPVSALLGIQHLLMFSAASLFHLWPMCQQYIHSSNSVWLSLAPSINLFCLIYHLGNSQAKSKTTNSKSI